MSAIESAFFGSLGRDAEVKISKAGRQYLRLNVRVGDGDAATWVSVMSFDDRAMEVADKLVKDARVYVEGRLELNEWTGKDGTQKHGLSVMSFHTRLSAIGRNRTKRKRDDAAPSLTQKFFGVAAKDQDANDFHNDEIPF